MRTDWQERGKSNCPKDNLVCDAGKLSLRYWSIALAWLLSSRPSVAQRTNTMITCRSKNTKGGGSSQQDPSCPCFSTSSIPPHINLFLNRITQSLITMKLGRRVQHGTRRNPLTGDYRADTQVIFHLCHWHWWGSEISAWPFSWLSVLSEKPKKANEVTPRGKTLTLDVSAIKIGPYLYVSH